MFNNVLTNIILVYNIGLYVLIDQWSLEYAILDLKKTIKKYQSVHTSLNSIKQQV